MNETEAYHYLRPSPATFWKWGDDGDVLLWSDGRTIAFRPEVHAVVNRLAGIGLPPFAAVVLALAAMRTTWTQDDSLRGLLAGYVRAALSPGAELPALLQDLLKDVLARLDALAALPEELRKSPAARALLVEMLFERVPPAFKPPGIGQVATFLAQGLPEFESAAIPLASEHAAEALALLKHLAACRLLTDVEAIRTRLRTGLEQTPGAPELHISDVVRGLLSKLRGDPQLGALARLAQALLAVIATPRRLTPETELPLGGFSDITNRGPLDRLLLTEIAHDDFTLAVRVALNEALYLRRESPRTPQAFTRVLFIDAGIRLWGLPRIFSTAAALAFAASTPKEASLSAFSAHGKTLLPIDFSTREGLLALLERLETEPHPAAALPALSKSLRALEGERSETIVLTHPDTFADAEFRQALDHEALYPFMVATVAGTGRFELSSVSAAGGRLLSQAQLKLDELMKPKEPQTPPLHRPGEELPAYYRLFASPFRLPLSKDLSHAVASRRHGLIGIVRRALVQWTPTGSPARPRQLTTLAMGNFLGIGVFEEEGTAIAARWDPLDGVLHLTSAALAGAQAGAAGQQRVNHQRLKYAQCPTALAGHNGAVLVLHRGRIEAYSHDRGVQLSFVEFPSFTRHLGSRFVEGHAGSVFAMAWAGNSLNLIPVPLPASPLVVFQRAGSDGPLGLYPDGSIRDSLGSTPVPPAVWAKTILRYSSQVSDDGDRLVVSIPTPEGAKNFGIDLAQPQPSWTPMKERNSKRFLLGAAADLAMDSSLQLRRNFHGICVVNGNLTLVSQRNKQLTLEMLPGNLASPESCRLAYAGRYAGAPLFRSFVQLSPGAAAADLGLRLATWPDGSRAWLDPRGLLHLRSSDPHLPEITLLLFEQSHGINAWTSDGKTYGGVHVLEDAPTATSDDLVRLLRAFVGRLK
jgi:hypothetical protein